MPTSLLIFFGAIGFFWKGLSGSALAMIISFIVFWISYIFVSINER